MGTTRVQTFQADKPLVLTIWVQARPGRTDLCDQIAELARRDHDAERAGHSLRQAALMVQQRLADGRLRSDFPARAAFDESLAANGADDSDGAIRFCGNDPLRNLAPPGKVSAV